MLVKTLPFQRPPATADAAVLQPRCRIKPILKPIDVFWSTSTAYTRDDSTALRQPR